MTEPPEPTSPDEAEPPWYLPYLPSVKEEGPYTGPFSTYIEYHATILGLAVGGGSSALEMPMIAVGVVMLILGLHGGVQMTNTKALNEMRREPWYAIAGIAFGYLGNDATLKALAWLEQFGIGVGPVPLPDPATVLLLF